MNAVRRVVATRLRVGRLALPAWLAAAAVLAIAAAAGQAVGPILAGSVTGTAGVTGEQALVLSLSSTTVSGHAGDDRVMVVNDEGTSFTAAIEMHVGDIGYPGNSESAAILLGLQNTANAVVSAILELSIPAGLDIEVEPSSGSNVEEAQLNKGTWLLRVPTSASGTVNIYIEPKDDAKPGFYTITGRVVQISG